MFNYAILYKLENKHLLIHYRYSLMFIIVFYMHDSKLNCMLCYVMLCYVMLCYVMLCYVMLCYVMLCHVMLCYVMLVD